MNVREGMRRFALLLGAAGAIVGSFASYFELESVLSQSARHDIFARLAASDEVKNERTAWPLALRYTPKDAIESLRKLPEGQQRDVLHTLTKEERTDLLEKLKCASSQWGVDSVATVQGNLSQVDPYVQYAQDDPYACTAESSDPPISTVNKDGIKTIHWSKSLGVESIETEDGQTLYPVPAPSGWLYLFAAILPVLGFVLPWGFIGAIEWVGTGFFVN